MQHNKSLAGAAEAIERTKNAGSEMTDEIRDTAGRVAAQAKRAYDDSLDTAQELANEAHDRVGDVFRSGEDFVRRRPIESLALTAAVAFAAGYLMRR